eukprot:GILK01007774.1.p1 GENE.GILK01007774.1~~GILK01007774.1.p1  ORF type:complete len:104 (-),score=20.22 GILK01007774.1:62-373(-)
MKKFNLPISVPAASGSTFKQEDARVQGDDVTIVAEFPDGDRERVDMKMGQNVEWLKGELAKRRDIPYGSFALYLNGSMMADPLSLYDLPIQAGTTTTVTVQGL